MHSPNRRDHAQLVPVSQPIATPSQRPSRATIGKLSDKALLSIFCYFLEVSPQHWPTLVHVCRKWRRIVFASQRALRLRLLCTPGTPVLETLDCWPASLPVVVLYGGSPALDPPAPEDEDNIIGALKQSDRVSSISLTVTSSLLEKLSAIERPFSELEDLILQSRDSMPPTLPSTFRWGNRLRCLHLNRISFSSLLRLLCSSTNLVDLQLHDVFDPCSPEALTNALSGMAQLRSISLHLLSTAIYLFPHPLSGERVVLPTLTRLNFYGTTKYLEGLMARIDTPRLGDIEVTYCDDPFFGLAKLGKFIDRIEMYRSHRRADILSSERAISISLIQPGVPTCLRLQLLCEPLRGQLSFLARICINFSALIFNVEDLRISAMRPESGQEDDDRNQWQGLIDRFKRAKWFHVAGDHSTILGIVLALQLSETRRHEPVLPALHKIRIREPGPRYAPLRQAAVSLMVSRWPYGRLTVEYERLRTNDSELGGTGHVSQHVTTEMLSEDILLNIFLHYLHTSPKFWPTLTLVCQRWRQIVLGSPLGLHLRLYCTYGTPVLTALNCWTALPIIIQYGGSPDLDPPAPDDDDNIIAALKQSGRVSSISLTVTSSLLKKLSAISEPFSELEDLALLSRDNMQLTLPSTFQWGPSLRTLYSTGIAFPSFPQLLLPSHDLTDLQLHEIPRAGYFSPEAFVNALTEMTRLETLSLHFLSLPPRRNHVGLPPPSGEHVVLPALTCLRYKGTSKYLDSLVARIDAPLLGVINITFFSQPTLDALQLGRFIERIEMQVLLSQADIETSADAVSITFTNSSSSTPLRLQISCKQSDWRLFAMAQVCDQFSPFLFCVNNLNIDTTRSSSGQDDVDHGDQWWELVSSFRGARNIWVAGEPSASILCALGRVDEGHIKDVLPSLLNLRVRKPLPMEMLFWDSGESFITSRRLSGCPVKMELFCPICDTSFAHQKELKDHLVANHACRVGCSYCSNFECDPGYRDLFREHLRGKHPEASRNDPLVSNFPTNSFELDSLATRHGTLHAPDTVSPSISTTGHPVTPRVLCHICNIGFTQSQELKKHLVSKHAYRLLCSYCGDFECDPGHRDLFREHLRSKHPEVARNDPLVSEFPTKSSELDILANRHSSLCAPDVVSPSTSTGAHPVKPQVLCHICNIGFAQSTELKAHLVSEHAYRLLCSYCGDFAYTLRFISPFRQHLIIKHPDVARNDPAGLKILARTIDLESFAIRHSSLCAQGVVTPPPQLPRRTPNSWRFRHPTRS